MSVDWRGWSIDLSKSWMSSVTFVGRRWCVLLYVFSAALLHVHLFACLPESDRFNRFLADLLACSLSRLLGHFGLCCLLLPSLSPSILLYSDGGMARPWGLSPPTMHDEYSRLVLLRRA